MNIDKSKIIKLGGAIAVGAILWQIYRMYNGVAYKMKAVKLNNNSGVTTDKSTTNLAAFLATIRKAEGTSGSDGYSMLFGGSHFSDFSEHPYPKQWKGVKLSDRMCINSGAKPGCISTAAGAYQIRKSTWNGIRAKMSLPDFSPESQDQAAIFLISQRNALEDVKAGRFSTAALKVGPIWASFPGNNYQQNSKSLAALQSYFVEAGGKLTA